MPGNGASENGQKVHSNKNERIVDNTAILSFEEANDLLHRLQSETAQVQAIFTAAEGPSSVLRGTLRLPLEERYWSMISDQETKGSAISFDLAAAIERRFGDERSMRSDAAFPFRSHYATALRFAFEDGSQLTLFELEDDEQQNVGETMP